MTDNPITDANPYMSKTYSLSLVHIAKVSDMAQRTGKPQGEILRDAIDMLYQQLEAAEAAAEPSAENIAEYIAEVKIKACAAVCSSLRSCPVIRVYACMAELVITRFFLRVRENLVCLVSLLELFLGLFVAGV